MREGNAISGLEVVEWPFITYLNSVEPDLEGEP